MNKGQKYALLVAAANVALVFLFPPYDYVSMLLGNVATFDGFYFVLAGEPHRIVNSSFLALETIVVLANACIAVLLLRTPPSPAARRPGGNSRQRAILGLVATNLILAVLFPPFENFSAITKAALPTFEGFYFVFEVALIMINGGLLWLLFRDKTEAELSAGQMRDLAKRAGMAQEK